MEHFRGILQVEMGILVFYINDLVIQNKIVLRIDTFLVREIEISFRVFHKVNFD